jgi:DNA-directed RNA polymerase specialized sigma24 family protein
VTACEARSPTAPYPVSYGIASACAARIQAPLPLQLHDIDDAERFVGAIVSRSGFSLSFHDAEDLGEYLLVECWQLSLRYQAGGISFSTWAGNTLRRRSVDWIRQQNGRTIWRFGDGRVHERPRRELVSFDDDAERDRMDLALGTESGDPAADCDPDRQRLLGDGSRSRNRDYALLGLDPPRRVA